MLSFFWCSLLGLGRGDERREEKAESSKEYEAEFDSDVCFRGSVAFTVWMRKGL